MKLEWINLMERALTRTTDDYIENGNLDLRILAVLIRQSIVEADSDAQIDSLLWNKLHDWNLVVGLKAELGI